MLGNSLFGAVKPTKNPDLDKYKYSGYGTGFNARGSFSLSSDSEFGKNVMIFGADTISLVHIDNEKKDIFIIGKGQTDGLHDAMLTAEKEDLMNFTAQQKKFWLSLQYIGVNSYVNS